jgi:hypothetical protein
MKSCIKHQVTICVTLFFVSIYDLVLMVENCFMLVKHQWVLNEGNTIIEQ